MKFSSKMLKEIYNKIKEIRKYAVLYSFDIKKLKQIYSHGTKQMPLIAIVVAGNIENRVVFIKNNQEYIIVCLNRPVSYYSKLLNVKILYEFDKFHYAVDLSDEDYKHLIEPNVLAVSLCDIDNFPFPRFPLGISNIASAIRANFLGSVDLYDMQLKYSANAVIEHILTRKYEIIALSVTFGQQYILNQILQKISLCNNYSPLIVIGGSLACLNYKFILSEYPEVIIAHGSGEDTMIDIIKYVKNELLLSQVRGIYYTKNNNFQKTQNVNPSFYPPELDLLNETLSNRGAMQLETTRGCFFSCSFCPREHKGKWRKIEPLSNFYMQSLSNIFSQHMQISKKIFIVDEEFIGYEKKSDKRILELSKKMKKYNFSFESSSRIDQVVRIEKIKIGILIGYRYGEPC